MQHLRTLALLILLSLAPALARSEGVKSPPDDLASLVATAVANNPELKASQARWRMFTSKARQASSLEDPMFMFKLQNLVAREPFSFGGSDPQTAKVIGISQQLPFWGKRAIREEIAQYEADSYKWSLEERKLELARMVKETWYQIYAVDRSIALADKNLRILTDFMTIAESKYSVGQGAQQDIYKAGLEKSKMLDMQITLRQQRRSLEANLNYLLARPDSTPVAKIPDFDLPGFAMTSQQLNDFAFAQRPRMKELSSLVNKGSAAHRLAQKEQWPDFNLSFEYMFREAVNNEMTKDPGYNMFTVGVTFNLPVQRERRQAMAAEASSETAMALEELNSLRNSIGYSISDTLAQMERLQKLAELYKTGTIPQAEQSLESAVISYKVNKVDFLTLLDSRMSLYTYELGYCHALAEYMMKLAQLEALIGVDPADLQALPTPATDKQPHH
ncbi:outer membrane efflux protein [Geobacter sp. OR-1]|uniref:TolC family protein n=1 Tax=Geobacter sp. OR-1 TaxID=1266765 RepID=UPI0005422AF9|nr:TolC family protein [Geobacter sp. OR-1]GAM11128.1 outer membrane efflux protein [Geobacter sp. OR-1]